MNTVTMPVRCATGQDTLHTESRFDSESTGHEIRLPECNGSIREDGTRSRQGRDYLRDTEGLEGAARISATHSHGRQRRRQSHRELQCISGLEMDRNKLRGFKDGLADSSRHDSSHGDVLFRRLVGVRTINKFRRLERCASNIKVKRNF